tara:strand:+ start:377 stop:1024 length:648 start_codon:yes stop_codon:yes gene_type:complete
MYPVTTLTVDQTAISIAAIFVFILIITGNFIGELLPCRVRTILSNNMAVKHAFGFFTLFFFVLLTIPELKDTNMFYTTTILYAIYIMMSKTHYVFWFIIFGLIGILYLLHIIGGADPNEIDDEETDAEKSDEKKEVIIKPSPWLGKETIRLSKQVLVYMIAFMLPTGFLVYLGEKKLEYKNKFSYFQFLLGKPSCLHESPKLHFVKSIRAAFSRY